MSGEQHSEAAHNLSVRLFDANCSIEGMWLVPMPRPSKAFVEAFEYSDELPDRLAKFAARWSDDERAELREGEGGEAAWEALFEEMYEAGEAGYVVQSAVPVFTNCGTGVSYSWGHYKVRAYYAATVDGAIELACAAAEADYAAAAKVPA